MKTPHPCWALTRWRAWDLRWTRRPRGSCPPIWSCTEMAARPPLKVSPTAPECVRAVSVETMGADYWQHLAKEHGMNRSIAIQHATREQGMSQGD